MSQYYVYIVFASTPYKMGRMIRKVTGAEYNHVSVALDPELKQMYSFARRNFHYPFIGGFVRESKARYHLNGEPADIKMCKIPVLPEKYAALKDSLQKMEQEKEKYLYNYLSILGMPFKRSIPVKDAYICVEFAVNVLRQVGYPLPSHQYYRIPDLEKILASRVIYTGVIGQGDEDPAFFQKNQIAHPYISTLKGFVSLFPRLQF